MLLYTVVFIIKKKYTNIYYPNRIKYDLNVESYSSSFHWLHSFSLEASKSQREENLKSEVFTERNISVFLQLQKKHLLL